MGPNRPYLEAGQRLKDVRERLGLSTRDVQRKSEQIAVEKRNQEYHISHAWLTDIEKGRFMPGFFKLYSLSAIYDRSFTEITSYFGMRIADLGRDRALIGVPRTYLVPEEAEGGENQTVSLPVELRPEFRFEKTNLLSKVVEKWQEIPIGLLQHLDLRKSLYGYIGLEDLTLYPLIRPGSLVQIDPNQRKVTLAQWRTEFERPIYFIEVRNGYLCGWCEIEKGQLVVIPHPQSRQSIRQFAHPSQAEVVGRVTGVAMRIVEGADAGGGATLR
jgi:transcriptional regulator with XRE-family HTH domain